MQIKNIKKSIALGVSTLALLGSAIGGAWFNHAPAQKAAAETPITETLTLSEELAKIDYTEEELTASGWNGAAKNAAKEALYKQAFEKSKFDYYLTSNYDSYKQFKFWDKAGDGTNTWVYKYTNVNKKFAICDNINEGSLSAKRIMGNTMGIYSRDISYAFVHSFGYTAPADGKITIPEHTLLLSDFETDATSFNLGFSVDAADRATVPVTGEHWTAYAEKATTYTIAAQTFEVSAGQTLYIDMYTGLTAEQHANTGGISHIVYDPTITFTETISEIQTTKLSTELAKIAYTEEEKTASGWDGTSRDANKKALFKTAFEKSDLKFYAGVHTGGDGNYWHVFEYYEIADGSYNSWKWSGTKINDLCVGNNYYADVDKVTFSPNGTHFIGRPRGAGATDYGTFWAIAWTAPADGTLTLPATALTINSTVGTATLQMAVTKGAYLKSNATGWTDYPESTTIAQQTFDVVAGDVIYLNLHAANTAAANDGVSITYDPSFVFTPAGSDPCANGHTEVVDKAVAPTCTEKGLTEGKHCSVCNTVLVAQTEVAANGHTEVVDKAVAPTCTEKGKTEGKHCSVCNTVLVAQTEVAANGHTEVVDKAVEPTCTEKGKTEGKHCSVCNTVLVAQTEVAANGHSFGEWTQTKAPTETEAGEKERTCACGAKETEVVPALGHTHTEGTAWEYNETHHWNDCVANDGQEYNKAEHVFDNACDRTCACGYERDVNHAWDDATCTAPKTCSACGATEGEALGHSWDDATCTAPKTCSTCGETEGTALGHSWEDATCTEPKTCSTCGETEGKANGHSFGNWVKVTDAQHARECACGEEEVEDHSFGEWTVTKPATEEATGLKERSCVCGEKQTEVIPVYNPNLTTTTLSAEIAKIAYTEEEKTASGWDGTSRDANKVALLKTAFDKSMLDFYATYAAAYPNYRQRHYYEWANDGNSWRFSYTHVNGLCAGNNPTTATRFDSNGSIFVYSGAQDIVWSIAFVAPVMGTLTIPEHTLTIEKFFNSQALQIGFSKGAANRATMSPKDASLNWQTIATTGEHVIPAQTFELKAGEVVYLNLYAYMGETAVSDGLVQILYDPTFEFLKETDPCKLNGHTEVVDKAVAPTCTDTGLTEGKHCSVCNTVLVAQTEVAAKGHAWKDATCTAPKTCSTCGETEGTALGHTWTDATCTAPKTCSVCGGTEGNALGHTEVVDKAVAPTCTEKGKTEGKHCSVCNAVIVAQREVAANGHTEVVDAAVAATCTETGLTEGKHCSVCNAVILAQYTVPELGHTWTDATCTAPKTCSVCGATEGNALGHTWTDATCTAPKTCSVCGATEGEALGHSFGEWTVTKEATETEKGSRERTCECGAKEVEEIPALGTVEGDTDNKEDNSSNEEPLFKTPQGYVEDAKAFFVNLIESAKEFINELIDAIGVFFGKKQD